MQPSSTDDGVRTTILFVDDTKVVADVAATVLRRAGFRVITALSAAQALDRLEFDRIRLIIADVHMPTLGGFELVSALKRTGVRATALYISGSPCARDARYANELFLTKPWSAHDLSAAVRPTLKCA